MNSQEVIELAKTQVQNQNEFMGTILWILFAVLIIAPLGMLLIAIPLAISKQPKCPNCNSVRKKTVKKKVIKDGKSTTVRLLTCARCGHVY